MKETVIRFTVTDGSEKRAATWRCWTPSGTGKSDVYLLCRELRGTLKASLHETGIWRIAFTEEFARENLNTPLDKPDSRLIMKWPRPPEIAVGMTLAFRIITPRSAVSTTFDISSLKSKNINQIPIPPYNRAIEIAIILTAPHTLVSQWPGKNSMNTKLVGSMLLDSGERAWVVYRITEIPNLGTLHGTPRYFKDKNKGDLIGADLRVLVLGYENDGSCTIVDCTSEKQ